MSYHYASSELIQVLNILIDKDNNELNNILVINRIANCWDTNLATSLMQKMKDENMKPKCMADLLEMLLDHGDDRASDFAKPLIGLPLPNDDEKRLRTIFSATALMLYISDADWIFLWPLMRQDKKFGREIVERVHRGATDQVA